MSDFDTDLDAVEVKPTRETLTNGKYTVALEKVIRVDGYYGIADLFEVTVLEASEGSDFAVGSKVKLKFSRDAKGIQGDIKRKQLAECLTAIKGGNLEGKSEFLSSLREDPSPLAGTKFKVFATQKQAQKTGNTFNDYKFFTA